MFKYYFASSKDGKLKASAVSGQVWLLEEYKYVSPGSGAAKCRHLLGDYELDSPNVPMTVQLTDSGFLFVGIVKCTRRSFRIWHILEKPEGQPGPGRDLLP